MVRLAMNVDEHLLDTSLLRTISKAVLDWSKKYWSYIRENQQVGEERGHHENKMVVTEFVQTRPLQASHISSSDFHNQQLLSFLFISNLSHGVCYYCLLVHISCSSCTSSHPAHLFLSPLLSSVSQFSGPTASWIARHVSSGRLFNKSTQLIPLNKACLMTFNRLLRVTSNVIANSWILIFLFILILCRVVSNDHMIEIVCNRMGSDWNKG